MRIRVGRSRQPSRTLSPILPPQEMGGIPLSDLGGLPQAHADVEAQPVCDLPHV